MNIVQFMHPGGEIKVTRNPVAWNVSGQHYRRLLCHSGEYVDSGNNSKHSESLCFWNEYEAPTNAYPTQQHPTWEYAHHYHKIIKPIQQSPKRQCKCKDDELGECCDNTDPCVFGDTFKYSNCQQVPGGDLWNLPPGSLILFGSLHSRSFYLDTVFVTDKPGARYSVPIANHPLPFPVSNDYMTVTLNNLMPRRNKRNRTNPIITEFMFYRGRLPVINCNGHVDRNSIFSFTPTRIFDRPDYNRRCKIDLATLNTRFQQVHGFRQFAPKLTEGHKTIVFNASQTDVTAIWLEVRNAVVQASFNLGYHFAW